GLERRRARAAHPLPVAAHGIGEPGFARGAGRLDGREDATARGVQLLVARAGRAQVELGHAIATEACVRVAVDEPRHRAKAATVMASGYPASTWRRTPVPGSVVSTRSSRSAISSVPSATTTIPAWSEFPIPTPPPWWTLTQVAPAATFSSAFRIGQSPIASEPSRIASVSRYGEATDPESR